MSTTHQIVAVAQAAVRLDSLPLQYEAEAGEDLLIQCPSGAASPLLIGGPGVTTAVYGLSLPAGSFVQLRLDTEDQIWAICAAGTVNAPVLRTRV